MHGELQNLTIEKMALFATLCAWRSLPIYRAVITKDGAHPDRWQYALSASLEATCPAIRIEDTPLWREPPLTSIEYWAKDAALEACRHASYVVACVDTDWRDTAVLNAQTAASNAREAMTVFRASSCEDEVAWQKALLQQICAGASAQSLAAEFFKQCTPA